MRKADYHVFIALTGVWYRSFPHLSSYKVLRIHLGMLPGSCFSPSLRPSHPSPSPAPAFKLSASAPIVRANSLSELSSLRPPRAQNSVDSVQGGPKSPGRFPNPLSPLP